MKVFEFNDERHLKKYFKFRKDVDYFKWVRKFPIKGDVLEVGCGIGHLSMELKDSTYTGIDVAQGSIKLAKKTFPQHKFICGNADKLAQIFKGRKFDWVIASDVFEHMDNPLKVVEQMARVTKSGGKILIKSPNEPNIYFFLKTGRNPLGWRKYILAKPEDFKWGSEADHKWLTTGVAFKEKLEKINCKILVYDTWNVVIYKNRFTKDLLLYVSKFFLKPFFPHLGYNFLIIAEKF